MTRPLWEGVLKGVRGLASFACPHGLLFITDGLLNLKLIYDIISDPTPYTTDHKSKSVINEVSLTFWDACVRRLCAVTSDTGTVLI